MKRYVVDTNVPIVANGRAERENERLPSPDCRAAAVKFLQKLLKNGKIVVDSEGEIQAEYRRKLNPRGQPGVGDRFYQEVLRSAPSFIDRVSLDKDARGDYVSLSAKLNSSSFDRSDRKFAALAKVESIPVVNSTDSDWLEHLDLLRSEPVNVMFLCGCKKETWFATAR